MSTDNDGPPFVSWVEVTKGEWDPIAGPLGFREMRVRPMPDGTLQLAAGGVLFNLGRDAQRILGQALITAAGNRPSSPGPRPIEEISTGHAALRPFVNPLRDNRPLTEERIQAALYRIEGS